MKEYGFLAESGNTENVLRGSNRTHRDGGLGTSGFSVLAGESILSG